MLFCKRIFRQSVSKKYPLKQESCSCRSRKTLGLNLLSHCVSHTKATSKVDQFKSVRSESTNTRIPFAFSGHVTISCPPPASLHVRADCAHITCSQLTRTGDPALILFWGWLANHHLPRCTSGAIRLRLQRFISEINPCKGAHTQNQRIFRLPLYQGTAGFLYLKPAGERCSHNFVDTRYTDFQKLSPCFSVQAWPRRQFSAKPFPGVLARHTQWAKVRIPAGKIRGSQPRYQRPSRDPLTTGTQGRCFDYPLSW